MSVSASTHTFITHDHWSEDIARYNPPINRATDGETGDKGKSLGAFAEDEASFWDLLDVINPLQHIPIINTIYRELTGDEIGVAARLAGGTLFGGPIGFAAAAINAAIESETGADAGGHLLALFRDGNDKSGPVVDEPVMLAQAPQPQTQSQAKPEAAPEANMAETHLAPPQPAIVQAASAVMFDVNGPVVGKAAPAPPPPAPAPAPAAIETRKVAEVQPAPIEAQRVAEAQPARFMPVPPRLPEGTMKQPPPRVAVPVSNNGTRSSVPLTGRDPVSNTPNAAAVQKMLEAQGMADAQHPLLPSQNDQGWIAASMARSLDKYEQATRLTNKADPAQILVQ